MSYRDAPTNSAKRRAYEAVNSYQSQVDKIITDLSNKKQAVNASLSELVAAENDEKLNLVYNKIKSNSEIYLDNNQKVIDNHEQRTRTAIKLESKLEITETEKQLAAKLRTIINGDTEKKILENLAKELSEFKSASGGEKKVIYNNYSSAINLMLEEIESELVRREQSQKDREKVPSQNNQKISPTNKNSTILPAIIGTGIIMLLIIFSLFLVSHRRQKLKNQERKKIK
jgi:hypothetical protein